jgi:hypothetical protein
MKLLWIDDSKGYFLLENGNFAEIDQITKEGLLRLVNLTLNEEDIEYDEYSDETVKNQAHQIVYKSVLEKLKELRGRRGEFVDESERLYLADYERYRPKQEAEE